MQSEFRTVPTDCAPWAQLVIDRAQDLLKREHSPRDDYRELLELVVVCLGGVPYGRTQVQFMAPGPVHRARWMARAIYVFKIWMFWEQFQVTFGQLSSRTEARAERMCTGLLTVCLFVAEKHCFAWFAATTATTSPRVDLNLLQFLEQHSTTVPAMAAALKSFRRHQWYLSEILVSLSLFDESVSYDEKRNMVKNMKEVDGDFCTSNSMKLFDTLKLPKGFLDIDPCQWDENPDYIQARVTVQALPVVNDTAERGVALVQEFTKSGRTKSEEHLQFMLQIVEDNRSTFPTASKKSLMGE